jgi:hypothetical protein
MGLSVLGLLVTDINFIFVALFSKHIPGGYWFLVVAPFIEGSLGGNCNHSVNTWVELLILYTY